MVAGFLLTPIPYLGSTETGFPLMIEFPINPELSPVLVSSTRGVIWADDRNGMVRAAFRKDLDNFFRSVILSSLEGGLEGKWDNSGFFSESGLSNALGFLRYYEIPEDYHLLVHPSRREETLPHTKSLDISLFEALWVPPNQSVLVPEDRSYLGSLIQHKSGMFASVIHNISRGMFILRHEN